MLTFKFQIEGDYKDFFKKDTNLLNTNWPTISNKIKQHVNLHEKNDASIQSVLKLKFDKNYPQTYEDSEADRPRRS